jgi:uncharacterized protein YndB with AHSA1/START domain
LRRDVAFGGPVEPIITEGIVNAPVDAVWKAFTTARGRTWMVAKTKST